MSLDHNDIYEFRYDEGTIAVVNYEREKKIALLVNGEVKDVITGFSALTGLGKLKTTLHDGRVVEAQVDKIEFGDSDCTVTIDGMGVSLYSQSHGKRDYVGDALDVIADDDIMVTGKIDETDEK